MPPLAGQRLRDLGTKLTAQSIHTSIKRRRARQRLAVETVPHRCTQQQAKPPQPRSPLKHQQHQRLLLLQSILSLIRQFDDSLYAHDSDHNSSSPSTASAIVSTGCASARIDPYQNTLLQDATTRGMTSWWSQLYDAITCGGGGCCWSPESDIPAVSDNAFATFFIELKQCRRTCSRDAFVPTSHSWCSVDTTFGCCRSAAAGPCSDSS